MKKRFLDYIIRKLIINLKNDFWIMDYVIQNIMNGHFWKYENI